MATAAQIIANQANAKLSTGQAQSPPLGRAFCAMKNVTAEGKARVSQNARKFGLFSVAAFIGPEERDIFTEFETGYMAELSPATPLEQTLAREIVHAAWRLRRCADLETNPPENMTDEELDRLQISVDRARAAAQRTFHRSLKELRRLQAGHLEPAALAIKQAMAADALLMQELNERYREAADERAGRSVAVVRDSENERTGRSVAVVRDSENERTGRSVAVVRDSENERAEQSQTRPAPPAPAEFAKQTQPPSPATAAVPRNSPCPCRSGNKYKRCCGKDAPPVLSA